MVGQVLPAARDTGVVILEVAVLEEIILKKRCLTKVRVRGVCCLGREGEPCILDKLCIRDIYALVCSDGN